MRTHHCPRLPRSSSARTSSATAAAAAAAADAAVAASSSCFFFFFFFFFFLAFFSFPLTATHTFDNTHQRIADDEFDYALMMHEQTAITAQPRRSVVPVVASRVFQLRVASVSAISSVVNAFAGSFADRASAALDVGTLWRADLRMATAG
jgi:hypothetical protein